MNNPIDTMVGIAIGAVLIVVVFLVLREVMLWYWKVNKMLEGMDKIHAELVKIRKQGDPYKEEEVNESMQND